MPSRPTRVAGIAHRRAGAGAPYLLIHGLGGESRVWAPVLGALQERHDVIAVDLPGFGRSPALPGDVAPTPQALAAALARLLDALGLDTVHVAGNSLGGWVALELARTGRARTVAGLCAAGLWAVPPSTGDDDLVRGRAQRLSRLARPIIPFALLSGRIRRRVLSPFVAHPERVPYRDAWRLVSSYARATAYDATSTAMRRDAFRDPDEIAVPVTLAFGDRDRLIRPARPAIPGVRTLTLADCGHIPMWDDPAAVTELLLTCAAQEAPERVSG